MRRVKHRSVDIEASATPGTPSPLHPETGEG